MRGSLEIVALTVTALICSASPSVQSAEQQALTPYAQQLRDQAAQYGPSELRRVACALFNERRAGWALIMREASDGGDDFATLTMSTYLNPFMNIS